MLRNALTHRHRKSAAHHVAEHVVDDEIEIQILEHALLLQQLHGGDDAAPGAADARGRAAGLDAIDAGEALEHRQPRIDAPLLGQQIEHGRDVLAIAQSVGGIRLRIATELHDLIARFRQRGRDVGGGRRFADAALAVDGDLLRFTGHKIFP